MVNYIIEFLNEIDVFFKAELLLRIIVALLCGGFIGYERTNRGKGAGIRTHAIVAMASCLIMIISQHGFGDFFANFNGENVSLGMDPSRVAAQIVSGIGFLGAGMIFVHKNTISGLTTAAGIWATSGIGMAIGGKMYFMGIFCTAIIILFQNLLHKNSERFHYVTDNELSFVVNSTEDVDFVLRKLTEYQMKVSEMEYTRRDDGKIEIYMLTQSPNKFNKFEFLEEMTKEENIMSVKI